MFSSVRKDSSGDRGEGDRDLSFEIATAAKPRPAPADDISVVLIGGGLLPSRDDDFGGLLPNVATVPIFGVSLTIGEYCEIGEAPLKAPGGGLVASAGGALDRLRPPAIVGEGALILPAPGGAGAGRGCECGDGPLARPEPRFGEG